MFHVTLKLRLVDLKLKVLKVSDLVYLYCALFMYDYYSNRLPLIFNDFFKSINKVHQYQTRLANKISYYLFFFFFFFFFDILFFIFIIILQFSIIYVYTCVLIIDLIYNVFILNYLAKLIGLINCLYTLS